MARHLLLDGRSFWSGLAGIMLTGRLAKALNLPQPAGILVQQVAARSPAAQMGLVPARSRRRSTVSRCCWAAT